MFSKYEIKRGNRRLLRLARMLAARKDNDATPLTVYARHTPSRWKLHGGRYQGLMRYVRGEFFSDKRIASAIKEFAITKSDAEWLFGEDTGSFVRAETIRKFALRRKA